MTDLKKFKGDLEEVRKVMKILEYEGVKGIPDTMKPHLLKGKYKNNWECHIKPDRLIIWINRRTRRNQIGEDRLPFRFV
jgi:mRNA interferase YafQ